MVVTDLILVALDSQRAAQRQQKLQALRFAGATSPATARPLAELDVVTDATWNQLLRQGHIREGAPGRFYLFELSQGRRRERMIKIIVFYTLLLLIPVILFFW